MPNFHVINPKGSDFWRVKKDGAGKASAIADTQKEAEKIAKQMAAN